MLVSLGTDFHFQTMPCRCHHCHFSQGEVPGFKVEGRKPKWLNHLSVEKPGQSGCPYLFTDTPLKLPNYFCITFIHCLVPGIINHSPLQKFLPLWGGILLFSPPLFFLFLWPPQERCLLCPSVYTLLSLSSLSMSLLYKWLPSFLELPFHLLISKHMFTSLRRPQHQKAESILKINQVGGGGGYTRHGGMLQAT